MPEHGQTGELSVYDRVSGNVHERCVSRRRWCAKCGEWVGGTGIVSMVVASVACPKCSTPWEQRAERPDVAQCPT